MTSRNRSYPDISFVNSDTDSLVNALITSYEKIVGRKLYPADPTRNFILWIADIIIQERILIDSKFTARQKQFQAWEEAKTH